MYRTGWLFILVVLGIGLAQSVFAAEEDPLVAWWKLDDGAGEIAVDSSGNGLDGTITDSNWVASGYDGTGFCLEMDRVGLVDLGNPDALNFGTSDWTVSAWVNTTIAGTEETERGTIYANGGDWGGGIRYTLCVSETQDGQVTLTCDDDSTKAQATGTTQVNDGEWHLVIGMREGTTIRVYIDGVAEGENEVPATYNLSGTSQHNAYIGAITDHRDATLKKTYKGLIDDVRIFRQALAENHVQDLYKGLTPDFHKAGIPEPVDGDPMVQIALLKWTAGLDAMFHNVYLGTSPELTEADLVMPRSIMALYFHVPGLDPGVTYYWRVDELEADGVTVHGGDVWTFTAQDVTAYYPGPSDSANDASTAPELTWLPGQAAVEHQVYFSDSLDAVSQGTAEADKGTLAETTFAPGDLDSATVYYWRVDEIMAGGEVKAGPVWSFATILPIEGFEEYTDDEGGRIYETWIDGWTNDTGSTVGYLEAPFAEQTKVLGGAQSMPLDYNNVNSPFYSETEREFSPAADLTANGVDTLVLFIQGGRGNSPAPLYVTLEDTSGNTATVSNPDPAIVTKGGWNSWSIPLSEFAGVNAARIEKMYIGVGDKADPKPDGTGLIFVDDIYGTRPAPAQ